MHKITLVCSAHRTNGLCNAEELQEILLSIKPEVIFVEMRPMDFDFHYEGGGVEAHAIVKYRKLAFFQLVPVDRYDTPQDLLVEIKRDVDGVLDYVARSSREYQLLDEENDKSVHQHGFGYLNSAAFATRTARMSEIEETIVRRMGDQDLVRGLERWRHLNQGRELEMVGNIYEYCRKTRFDTGVFLVGAAHKAGIVKEIEKYVSTEVDLISWNLAYGDQIP
jgi:hypothetical protein